MYYRALIAKANSLIEKQHLPAAITILNNTAEEIKNQKGEVGKWESLIRVIRSLKSAHADEQAIELSSYVANGIKGTPTGGLAKETASEAYRAAGDLDTARGIMRELAAASSKNCTIVGDEINGHYAVELYRLELFDDFNRMVQNLCSDAVSFNTWTETYSAAREDNLKLPNIETAISELNTNLHAEAYNSFASTHFRYGENDAGNGLLDKAVEAANYSKNTAALCHTANLAYYQNRPELLAPLLSSSLKVANRPIHAEEPKYKDFVSKFLSPKQEPLDYDFVRYKQLLETAACFNQIEMRLGNVETHSSKKQ